MDNKLGKTLKELRGIRSFRTIAELTNNKISHNQIKLIEEGAIPKPKTLQILSEAYSYSYETLLELAGYIPGENKAEKIFNEFINLSEGEKKKFFDMIKDYIK